MKIQRLAIYLGIAAAVITIIFFLNDFFNLGIPQNIDEVGNE